MECPVALCVDESANGPDILEALLSALGDRHGPTRSHSHRACAYADVLGRQHGLREPDLAVLEYGALLHDLGKIGLDDRVFLKPGKLDAAEWEQMRRHPELGYGMLSRIALFDEARTIVLQHHERWDGHGYPVGLEGEAIHLGARIFAVADTLDAMTTHRPYRQALTFETAWDEIHRCRGSQFDPAVVDTFSDLGRQAWSELVAAQRTADPEIPHDP